MQKGFTLVELSIVLVIIGLLIGGILVGQSLVESAKVNAQVREINQIQIAYDLFKERYRCVPGDCALNLGTTPGDGSNILNCAHERVNFWQHLNNTNILTQDSLSGTYTSCSTAVSLVYGTNVYNSQYGDSSAYFASNTRVRGAELRNGLILAKHDGNPTYTTSNVGKALLDPKFVLSIDTKMDDSIPLSGDVQAGEGNDNYAVSPWTWCHSTASWNGSSPPSNTTYTIANDGEQCVLVYYLEE